MTISASGSGFFIDMPLVGSSISLSGSYQVYVSGVAKTVIDTLGFFTLNTFTNGGGAAFPASYNGVMKIKDPSGAVRLVPYF
jgi:hypothetical protein